ncbi:MAG TPA: MutH/Sau3AI family endonuclease [Myxococcales bacterium]|jgi:DNA mismatch repair protein MutH
MSAAETDLLRRMEALRGCTLGALAQMHGAPATASKGWTGMLLERALGATAGSRAIPDFPALGIELKSVGVDGHARPLESTFVASLNLAEADHRWETSAVRKKLARIAWVVVDASMPLLDRRCVRAFLWSPSAAEEATLRGDYEDIIDLLQEGFPVRATTGSALQLRPKGRDASHLRRAVNEDGELALAPPRAFYLRRSFVAGLLDQARRA